MGIWLNFHKLNQNPNAMLRLLSLEGIPKKTKRLQLTRSLIHLEYYDELRSWNDLDFKVRMMILGLKILGWIERLNHACVKD